MKFGMSHANPTPTLIQQNSHLTKSQCPQTGSEKKEVENVSYRETVDNLLWVANVTRPNIA